jgi:hypothetical protein
MTVKMFRFLTLFLSAITTGGAVSHALEVFDNPLKPDAHSPVLSVVEFLASVMTFLLLWFVRRQRQVALLTLVAGLSETAVFIVFLITVALRMQPMIIVTLVGHALIAGCWMVALAVLIIANLIDQPQASVETRPLASDDRRREHVFKRS